MGHPGALSQARVQHSVCSVRTMSKPPIPRVLFAQTLATVKGTHAGNKQLAAKKPAANPGEKTPRYNIGIIDISARAGLISEVLAMINARQDRFKFHKIEASLPVGLGHIGERVRQIALECGHSTANSQWPYLDQNVFTPDIFKHLRLIRQKLSVRIHALVGLVEPMLASEWTENGQRNFGWNYYSVNEGVDVIASAADLRVFARKAKRPFEACMMAIVVAQVCAALFEDVTFHDDTRGDLFDYNEERATIVKMLKTISIDDASLAMIPMIERKHLQAVLSAIRDYRRDEEATA